MSYTFTRTVPHLVAKILRKLNRLGVDETPSAEHTAIVREAMDMRLKELHSLGRLWFNISPATTDLALVAGTATKSLSAVTDFLFPVSMRLRVGTEDKPIEIVTHDRYQAVDDKTERGEPSMVYVNAGTAYFWPTPDSNYTVKLTYQAIAEDTTSAGAPDLPSSMMNAFATLVAGDLVEEYNIKEPKATRMLRAAAMAERQLMNLNAQRVDNAVVEIEAF